MLQVVDFDWIREHDYFSMSHSKSNKLGEIKLQIVGAFQFTDHIQVNNKQSVVAPGLFYYH